MLNFDLRAWHSVSTVYHAAFWSEELDTWCPDECGAWFWNNLPSEARQCTTLNSFKHFLKKDKSSVPNYYYHGNRKAQILHARLRTGCSSLNLDLFYKNITDSPLCLCGSVEDPQHFFFHCRFYQAHRNILLNAITGYYTPSLRLLLYGDPSLSQEINRDIFDHVHKFIIDTKRF